MSCSQLTSIEQWHRSLSPPPPLQDLKFPIIGCKPCLHKQVVQIRIQVSHMEAVLERWTMVESAFRGSGYWQGRQVPLNTHVRNFSRIIFKLGKDIYCPKILEDFDYGGSASLNMCIMDHLRKQPLWAFLDSFFKLVTKFGTNVGIIMLINLSFGFYQNRPPSQKFLAIFFRHLQLHTLKITVSTLNFLCP